MQWRRFHLQFLDLSNCAVSGRIVNLGWNAGGCSDQQAPCQRFYSRTQMASGGGIVIRNSSIKTFTCGVQELFLAEIPCYWLTNTGKAVFNGSSNRYALHMAGAALSLPWGVCNEFSSSCLQ
jgi:hypothetical protein